MCKDDETGKAARQRGKHRVAVDDGQPEEIAPVTVHRVFEARLRLRTECRDEEARALTLKEVRAWFAQQFVGCDLGNVRIVGLKEFKRYR